MPDTPTIPRFANWVPRSHFLEDALAQDSYPIDDSDTPVIVASHLDKTEVQATDPTELTDGSSLPALPTAATDTAASSQSLEPVSTTNHMKPIRDEHGKLDGKNAPLTPEEIQQILFLTYEQHLTQVEVANRVGVSQPTVSALLKKMGSKRLLGEAIVQSQLDKLADRLVERANAEEILDIFDRDDHLRKRKDKGDSGVVVVTGFNLADIKIPGHE